MSKKRKNFGLPPGSVIYTGNKKVEQVTVHYFQYDSENLTKKQFHTHGDIILKPSPDEKVDWYDVRGLHDTQLIEHLGKTFTIHPLVLEDAADVSQRPKFEEYDNGSFLSIRALSLEKNTQKIHTEQVGLFFRRGLLLSFQETDSDLFETVRTRIETSKGRIRQRGTDYLTYALIDVITDHYFVVLEEVGDIIELLEDKILEDQSENTKSEIHHLKKELLFIRKSISPLREALGRLSKSEADYVEDNTIIFLRNAYDHTIQIMDIVESYRDILNGLQDLYISELSFKMNQVMQLLTLIATIFIPITFLAGIYGMNFEYMPELQWKYSYFVFWAVVLTTFIGLIYYFKKKKWI